jgi:hypothetical protein
MRNTVVDLASRDHLRAFSRYCGLPRPSNTIVVVYGQSGHSLGLCFCELKKNLPGQFQKATTDACHYRIVDQRVRSK